MAGQRFASRLSSGLLVRVARLTRGQQGKFVNRK